MADHHDPDVLGQGAAGQAETRRDHGGFDEMRFHDAIPLGWFLSCRNS